MGSSGYEHKSNPHGFKGRVGNWTLAYFYLGAAPARTMLRTLTWGCIPVSDPDSGLIRRYYDCEGFPKPIQLGTDARFPATDYNASMSTKPLEANCSVCSGVFLTLNMNLALNSLGSVTSAMPASRKR